MATFSESIGGMWRGLDRGLKIVFAACVLLVLGLMVWGAAAVLRDDYRTLFTQLSDGDAAAIVEALKKQKVPYKLSDGGATISVPVERVHETRLGLMSSNVALSGNVGFEIFDKQGLGATEQSQRVSYQRALQGELARTITALENVKNARVHLVLPESSLFKRDKQQATASVTLTMRPGFEVDRQQILGVQRLVAASVPGLDPTRVTISDHRGITLSAAVDPTAGSFSGVESRLELQRQVESHVAQKVAIALDRAYGPGQAIISVAVALSFDAIKTTTQDLIPVRGVTGGDGGVKRRRQTSTGDDADVGEGADASRRASSSTEVEFDYGRRIEEVIAAPGAVRRMTIGVIVPPSMSVDEQSRLREFVLVAAGVDVVRGDLVSVQSLAPAKDSAEDASSDTSATGVQRPFAGSEPQAAGSVEHFVLEQSWLTWGAAVLAVILIALAYAGTRFRKRALSVEERNRLLMDIKRALADEGRAKPVSAQQS